MVVNTCVKNTFSIANNICRDTCWGWTIRCTIQRLPLGPSVLLVGVALPPGFQKRLDSRDLYRWASIHDPAFLVFHEKVWPRKECGKHLRFTTVQRGASANAETTPRRRNNIAHNCVMYHHHYHYYVFGENSIIDMKRWVGSCCCQRDCCGGVSCVLLLQFFHHVWCCFFCNYTTTTIILWTTAYGVEEVATGEEDSTDPEQNWWLREKREPRY